jgi:hypothetical protein
MSTSVLGFSQGFVDTDSNPGLAVFSFQYLECLYMPCSRTSTLQYDPRNVLARVGLHSRRSASGTSLLCCLVGCSARFGASDDAPLIMQFSHRKAASSSSTQQLVELEAILPLSLCFVRARRLKFTIHAIDADTAVNAREVVIVISILYMGLRETVHTIATRAPKRNLSLIVPFSIKPIMSSRGIAL